MDGSSDSGRLTTHHALVVGYAATPFGRRDSAPHQPQATTGAGAGGATGTVTILPRFRDALQDLESFSRVWVLFALHRSTGFGLRVKPPCGGPRRGVFATRAPNRPCQIGLTCARVVSVNKKTGEVVLDAIDLLDGRLWLCGCVAVAVAVWLWLWL